MAATLTTVIVTSLTDHANMVTTRIPAEKLVLTTNTLLFKTVAGAHVITSTAPEVDTLKLVTVIVVLTA